MRRWGVVVALVLLVQLTGGSAEAAPTPSIVGDSLIGSARGHFPSYWLLRAKGGRTLADMAPLIRNTARSRQRIVIALGTNDVYRARTEEMADPEAFWARSISDTRVALRGNPACQVWVTVKDFGNDDPERDLLAARFNTLLESRVRRVADWASHARSLAPTAFKANGRHLTADGARAYANFLRSESVRLCRPRR